MEQRRITQVTVRSLAFMTGVMALAWGILVALVWIAIGLGNGPFPGFPELLLVVLGSPLVGVAIGAIAAIFFNLAAVAVGGLEVRYV